MNVWPARERQTGESIPPVCYGKTGAGGGDFGEARDALEIGFYAYGVRGLLLRHPSLVTHTHTHLLTLEPSAVHSLPHTLPGRFPCKCWLWGLALLPLNQDL